MASSKKTFATLYRRGTYYSIRYDPGGAKHTETRKLIATGFSDRTAAERIREIVDQLLYSKQAGTMVPAVIQQKLDELATANPKLHERLVDHGLAEPPDGVGLPKLGELLDKFFAERGKTVVENTRKNWGHTKRNLLAFFGPECELRTITKGHARSFESFLIHTEKLGERTTTRRRIGNCKMFFNFAKDFRWIDENPFSDLKSNVESNDEKFHFVESETAQRVLDACTDTNDQVIFALARYGGLRCPSEITALKWSDIDWKSKRITVSAPKTRRFAGKDKRVIPLYPELAPYLEAGHNANPGEFVVSGSRNSNANLRTRFVRIIKTAGIEPWPKIFQNLRSTRQTELVDKGHRAHVVAKWMGNSEVVAKKHYYQVTDDHFKKALEEDVPKNAPRKNGQEEENTGSQMKNSQESGNSWNPEECVGKLVGVTEVESVTSCMSSQSGETIKTHNLLPRQAISDFTHRPECLHLHDLH